MSAKGRKKLWLLPLSLIPCPLFLVSLLCSQDFLFYPEDGDKISHWNVRWIPTKRHVVWSQKTAKFHNHGSLGTVMNYWFIMIINCAWAFQILSEYSLEVTMVCKLAMKLNLTANFIERFSSLVAWSRASVVYNASLNES